MVKKLNNEQGFAHVWLAVIAVAVVLTAAGLYVAKQNNKQKLNSTTETQTVSQAKPLASNLSDLLTVDKVKQLATESKPGSTVSQIGLVQTSKGPVFHVELADGTSLDLDAKTGDKVETTEAADDTETTHLPAGFTPAIDFAKAEQIALGQVTNGSIVRIQLGTEDNKVVYAVKFSTGTKVLVDATTGAVIKVDAAKAQGKQPTSKDSENSSSDNSTTENETTEKSSTTNSSSTSTTTDDSGSGRGGSNSGSGH